jgi:uncharacterized protein YjaG (DUF416 family)
MSPLGRKLCGSYALAYRPDSVAFDLDALEKRVARLPPRHRAAFAALCTERMLPNYAMFSRLCRWGDPLALRNALDKVYDALAAGTVDPDALRKLKTSCEKLIPDLDDFADESVSWAADAGNALVATFECLLTGDPRQAAACASAAKDTVDNFIQEQTELSYSDPVLAGKLEDEPLLLREMSRQQYSLDALEKLKALDAKGIKQLRTEFGGQGKSNINLDWREQKRK